MAHVPAIQKAGLHEATRIAQLVMQREAHMAVLASAGERADRARSERVPPPERVTKTDARPDQRGERRGQGDEGADGGSDHRPPRRHIDLSA